MAENQEITITFTARTTAVLAPGTLSQNRVQAVGTRTVGGSTQTFTATDFAYVAYGQRAGWIDKTSSAADAALSGRHLHLHGGGHQSRGIRHHAHRRLALSTPFRPA